MKRFKDDLNTAVITTKYVFKDNLPILHVFHHEEDGFWEFVGNQNVTEDQYLLVSLEELIKIDASVLEVADLPYGKEAFRETKESPWKIKS